MVVRSQLLAALCLLLASVQLQAALVDLTHANRRGPVYGLPGAFIITLTLIFWLTTSFRLVQGGFRGRKRPSHGRESWVYTNRSSASFSIRRACQRWVRHIFFTFFST